MSNFDKLQEDFWNENTNLRSYDHPVVRTFASQRIAFIKELIGNSSIRSCLEVGCGDGFGMYYMQELTHQIFGCDLSLTMLKKNPIKKTHLSQANIYDLPYKDKSIDLVYCWEVLHHIREPIIAVREMKRVSRKIVLIFEPNSFNLPMAIFGLLGPSEIGLLRFSPWYLRRLLLQVGFSDIIACTVGCFTPNRTPMWLANLLVKLPFRWPLIGLYNVAIGKIVD